MKVAGFNFFYSPFSHSSNPHRYLKESSNGDNQKRILQDCKFSKGLKRKGSINKNKKSFLSQVRHFAFFLSSIFLSHLPPIFLFSPELKLILLLSFLIAFFLFLSFRPSFVLGCSTRLPNYSVEFIAFTVIGFFFLLNFTFYLNIFINHFRRFGVTAAKRRKESERKQKKPEREGGMSGMGKERKKIENSLGGNEIGFYFQGHKVLKRKAKLVFYSCSFSLSPPSPINFRSYFFKKVARVRER